NQSLTSLIDAVGDLLCCINHRNQRMHNKLLLVDDSFGITGGRNYKGRYFGWDPEFNFRDRDVLVAGPAARQMAASFKLFWQHPRSVPLAMLSDVNRQILADGPDAPGWRTPSFVRPVRVARVRAEAANPEWLRENVLSHSLRVGKVGYFSDLPSKTDAPHRKKAHELTLHIMRMVAG